MSLICPKCEKPLEAHVDGHCQKRLSRRFFLGALGSAFATAAVAKVIPNVVGVDMAAGPDVSVVQVFRPKVHQGGAIHLESNVDLENFFSPRQMGKTYSSEQVLRMAQESGRQVFWSKNGKLQHYADPHKGVVR